jgi:hypothetical protein
LYCEKAVSVTKAKNVRLDVQVVHECSSAVVGSAKQSDVVPCLIRETDNGHLDVVSWIAVGHERPHKHEPTHGDAYPNPGRFEWFRHHIAIGEGDSLPDSQSANDGLRRADEFIGQRGI